MDFEDAFIDEWKSSDDVPEILVEKFSDFDANVLAIIKFGGANRAYYFEREFSDAFDDWVSQKLHMQGFEREDFESKNEHLERVGCIVTDIHNELAELA